MWKAPFAKLLICFFFSLLRCFMMSVDLNVLLQNTKGNYSQLCRKLPSLVHDKGVAYGRWSLKSSGRYETVDCIPFSLPLTMIEAGVGI